MAEAPLPPPPVMRTAGGPMKPLPLGRRDGGHAVAAGGQQRLADGDVLAVVSRVAPLPRIVAAVRPLREGRVRGARGPQRAAVEVQETAWWRALVAWM